KEFVGTSDPSKYPIAGKLGEGTFGEVHKSTTADGRVVALKRILVHSENDGVPITTLREIKLLKLLSHPNVVPVIDMILARGKIFMVFPFADHDLAGLLENPDVSWDQKLIKLYAQQLLQGTNYLHINKILHRDMKTANLLINNKGVLQIADFGLARTFSAGGDRGGSADPGGPEYTNMVVTRWYRPPELLLGLKKYGPSIDMWGVGCVIAEMFSRRPILQGNSDPEQLAKIWELCGSPTDSNFPNWNQWGGCEGSFCLPSYPKERHVVDEFSRNGSDFADLMDKLLTLNPAKRMSAREALEHKWFWSVPLPMNPDDLPEWSSSHEFTRKKKPVALPPPPPPPPPPTNVGYPSYPPPGFGAVPPVFAPYGQQQQQQQQGFPPPHHQQQQQQGYHVQPNQSFRPPLPPVFNQQNPYGAPPQQQQQPIYGQPNQQMYGHPSFPHQQQQQQQPNRNYPPQGQNNFRPPPGPPPPSAPNPYGSNNPRGPRAPVHQASTLSKPVSNFSGFLKKSTNASGAGGVAVRPAMGGGVPRAGAGARPGFPPRPPNPSGGASGSGGDGGLNYG
ncbi:kinase-like domain-containing protein, partial [Mrakia frigida]|uniref:kinase-like domain-containing protein n=1 Tax=Mrakia frigida TaxID=29902 RepID=UPI003FCBF599